MKLGLFLDKNFNYCISISFLIIGAITSIIISNQVYVFEEVLSKQDSRFYILLAENLKNYFEVPQQVAMRILPSLLANFVSNIFDISIFQSFKILSYIFFILIHIKVFSFFYNKNFKCFLCFAASIIFIYSSHSIIYSIFHIYQLLDLMLIFFGVCIVDSAMNKKYIHHFFYSFCAIFTKEFLIVLIVLSYCHIYQNEKKNLNFIFLITIILFFFINLFFAGSNMTDEKSIDQIILNDYINFDIYFQNFYNSLFAEKNIFLFFPFILICLNKKILKKIYKFKFFILYTLVPISFCIFIYHLVGNNFFRVYFQGYFLVLLLLITFVIEKIQNCNWKEMIFFFSPICFCIDFLIIFFNLKKMSFFEFFQYERYSYFSGFYLFSLLIIYIFFYDKKKISSN